MNKKRPTIKGKGADFFFAPLEKPQSKVVKFNQKTTPAVSGLKQGKMTAYLPQILIDKVENVWLDLRRTHRKLRKYDITRIAFEELLSDYDKEHQNSKLVKHLNVQEPEHRNVKTS